MGIPGTAQTREETTSRDFAAPLIPPGTYTVSASSSGFQTLESTARSRYETLSFFARLQKKWGQANAHYTLSKLQSDDDNERAARHPVSVLRPVFRTA